MARVQLSPSANIAASGATATTARLTAPAGKTSGADFQAGTIQDDTNPAPALNLTSGKYTELEWCLQLIVGQAFSAEVYEFRVTAGGVALPLYSVTPQITGGITASGAVTPARTLAGSGTAGVIGSGGVTVAPALTGTATQRITGSGTVSPAPVLAATGLVAATVGSGSVTPARSLAGTGTQTYTASGSATPVPALAGTGAQSLTGSGSVTPATTLNGTGTQTLTGSGSVTPIPALSGTGTAAGLITGSVTVTPALSGTGVVGNRIILSASTHIAAGAATPTTARLVAPAGKTSGANFQAGKIGDDTNPLTLDLTSDKYTELEWCIKAASGFVTSGEVYEFRVTVNGAVLGLYSVAPLVTLAQLATGVVTPVPALAGLGTQTSKATGGVTVAPALAATGSTNTIGQAAAAVPVPSLAASGSVVAPITGTGSVAVPQPLINFGDNLNIALPILAAVGTSGYVGSIALPAPTLAISAQGTAGAIGAAAITTAPSLAAVGTVQVTGSFAGSGAPQVAPTLNASGTQTYTGTGSSSVPITVSGFSEAAHSGTGGVIVPVEIVADGAQTQIVLSGDASVTVTAPALGGEGSVTGFVTGFGAMRVQIRFLAGGYITRRQAGKYGPEHDSALITVGEVDGFADEHASARQDVEKAGV